MNIGTPFDLLLEENWFHTIELKPGVFTPGIDLWKAGGLSLTRKMLSGCEIQNASCLDVGTMDGLVAALLCRRGANQVVACDRYDYGAHIEVVKKMLNIDFIYWPRITLPDLRTKALNVLSEPFDLIVFSGVLYHMYDPMNGLALIRSMTRPGGLVIVETIALLSKQMIGYFNAGGAIVRDCHNYWNLSVELLDYLLRFFRLMPVDCCFFEVKTLGDGSNLVRIGVACKATPTKFPDEGDNYMAVSERDDDAYFPDWHPKTNRAPLNYSPSNPVLVKRASGAVDLYESLLRTRSLNFHDDDVRLRLGATL